ncbi:hypothetical protein ANACOL_01513 [Anaerotruncus colihominis DSM 17241]|uniref:Uncharacterized protein n=1 Tax=Anaerotruncus colihominis DSM 17241 TaxID=445972 RepID=B0P9U4_9FIRM|nr:hypothetical protein ANACOL_01513 [Anaerotruncus colihominis DSM 17241]
MSVQLKTTNQRFLLFTFFKLNCAICINFYNLICYTKSLYLVYNSKFMNYNVYT